MKTYYKVVKTNLTSGFATGKVGVQYKIGEYVRAPKWLPPNHQVLFVFRRRGAAQDFADSIIATTLHVYECRAKNESCIPYYLSTDRLSCGIILYSDFGEFPLGTVAVKQVKLIRRKG